MRNGGRFRGSYTIEAAILVPVLCMIFSLMIFTAFGLYREISEEAEAEGDTLWSVTYFYIAEGIGEVIND